MKSRDEAFDCARKCVNQIKCDTGKDVTCLVSDCGSEFLSNRMRAYLMDKNIAHKTSAPFVHEQNGFIERENMNQVRVEYVHTKD